MKKANRKKSPNRITCNISGETRMSNKTYLANKGDKFGVTGNVWASFYVNKESYKALVLEVEAGGLDFAANIFKVSRETIIKYLRYNGRGKFVKVGNTPIKKSEEVVEVAVAA